MIIDGNNFISHHLKHNKLFAAGKIGVTELKILYSYFYNNKKPEHHSFQEGYVQSGIFPLTEETYHYFCEVYIESLKCLDLAPQWCQCLLAFENQLYKEINPKCYNTNLVDLEPYYFDKPWTSHLKDKKVLVVSPFAKTIEMQHKNLSKIWNNKIVNNFEIDTIGFPFSRGLCNTDSEFKSYKDGLEKTKEKIHKKNFDFCILGVGAYSLPLCSFIKSLGKSSLHLGGATQVLFGIKGRRWEEIERVRKFFNEHWVSPSTDEIPEKYKLMEGGCYW